MLSSPEFNKRKYIMAQRNKNGHSQNKGNIVHLKAWGFRVKPNQFEYRVQFSLSVMKIFRWILFLYYFNKPTSSQVIPFSHFLFTQLTLLDLILLRCLLYGSTSQFFGFYYSSPLFMYSKYQMSFNTLECRDYIFFLPCQLLM